MPMPTQRYRTGIREGKPSVGRARMGDGEKDSWVLVGVGETGVRVRECCRCRGWNLCKTPRRPELLVTVKKAHRAGSGTWAWPGEGEAHCFCECQKL